MANTSTITLRINAIPAMIGFGFAGWLMKNGAPAWLGFNVARASAWIRISHAKSKPWHGWEWIGRNMRLSDG